MGRSVTKACLLCLLLGTASPAAATQAIGVDAAECREAAQFIGNAALSRRNGATREMFVGKLDEDLFILSSMPPAMRWFAHSDDEAKFLREAVLDVFVFPREPREHAAAFLVNCLRAAGLDATNVPEPDLRHDRPDNNWAERG